MSALAPTLPRVADWAWIAETTAGQALGELTYARSRKLTFDLRGACTATFTLDGRTDQGRDLAELATDLFIWRDRQLLFRGRLGSSDDDFDADRHNTSWSAVDYRGMLDTRIAGAPRTYDAASQDDIGWDLVTVAQAGIGGNLGITRGSQRAAAVARTEEIDAEQQIGKALDRFQDYADGFEYWITPALIYEAASWRGVAHDDFPLAWGSSVTALKRSYDTTSFANWVRVVGARPDGASQDDPVPTAERWAPDLATRREGRIARTVNNSDLKSQAAVDAAAEQLLADSLNPPASYTATLARGIWTGVADVWLGDRIPLVLRSGRLNIASTCRVAQIQVDLDDDGGETVELTVGSDET